jgi:hypothetical protein
VVDDVGNVKHAEGDVAGAAGDVEDVLGGAEIRAISEGAKAGIERGNEVVSGGRKGVSIGELGAGRTGGGPGGELTSRCDASRRT